MKLYDRNRSMKSPRNNKGSAFLLLSMAVGLVMVSCSSGSNSGDNDGQKKTRGNGSQDALPVSPFNDWKDEWESDVSDAKVKPCPAGKAFAAGTCFDEVHVTSKRIALSRPGETFTFVEAGRTLSPFILANYTFSEDRGDSFILINERLSSIQSRTVWLGRYWFLPVKIRVSRTNNPKDLSKAVFLGAEFPLASSHGTAERDAYGLPVLVYFKGSVTICGETVALPLTQKTLEASCDASVGSAEEYGFESSYGSTRAYLETPKEKLSERRMYSLAIGDTAGLR